MKFIIFYTVLAVSALGIAACQSYLTYEELEVAAEGSPEMQLQLENFERDAARADEFIEQYWHCMGAADCYALCTWRGGPPVEVEPYAFESLSAKVRWYRKVRQSCRFVK